MLLLLLREVGSVLGSANQVRGCWARLASAVPTVVRLGATWLAYTDCPDSCSTRELPALQATDPGSASLSAHAGVSFAPFAAEHRTG